MLACMQKFWNLPLPFSSIIGIFLGNLARASGSDLAILEARIEREKEILQNAMGLTEKARSRLPGGKGEGERTEALQNLALMRQM